MVILPMQWMVFTNAIMVSMWWIGLCLARLRQCWTDYNATQGPQLLFMRRARVRKPPEKSKGRPVGSDKDGQRMLADIIERESVLGTKRTLFDRLLRRKPTGSKRHFVLLALQVASAIAMTQPDITITETKNLRNRLRRYKRGGQMMTGAISKEDRVRLRKVLDDVPQGLLAVGDSFELIFDTGCTKTGTGFTEDFIPGTLQDLDEPIRMDGIAG